MKLVYTFLCLLLFFSCNTSQKEKEIASKPKPLMSVFESYQKTIPVKKKYAAEVANWHHLKQVDSFLVKYTKISPNEALRNAEELKDLVKQLKDSVKPIIFETPSLNARVNILYNEALRLEDISTISVIEPKAVNEQVNKVLQSYSALTVKINSLLSKLKFEEEITINVKYIGLDSTQIDSISRSTILKRDSKILPSNKRPIKIK
ncbi:hypothetical protein [Polaribacter tangerinus]|uniref:hypothetical protein n=1 Tax=Polaribacter tangerinus TaxID=1920034 RepID=UPI000B4BCEC2|nr:hypothetical protein [Polaribacter tangerinus]